MASQDGSSGGTSTSSVNSSDNSGGAPVWGTFSLVQPVPPDITVHVHATTSVNSPNLATVADNDTVSIVCSVIGEHVASYAGDSSNWDYIVAPVNGWVADVFIDTGGSSPPRCR